MTVPAAMQALVTADVHTAKVQIVDTPKPDPSSEALIKVLAVTLNPTDWKHIELISPPGKITGCDFTGEIVSLPSASKAPYKNLKVGDRVAGYVHGSYSGKGSFAEYITLEPELLVKVPDNVSSEVAASVGIGGSTAAQALFAPDRLGLKLPDPASSSSNGLPPVDKSLGPVLIWSGSTSVGQWAIQLARSAGYYVITTASPKNHDLVTSLGASEVYDYRDDATPDKISAAHPTLVRALDCISENGTQQLVVRSLGKDVKEGEKAKIVVLLKPDKDAIALRQDVEIIHTLIYSALGHAFTYGRASFSQEQVDADKKNLAVFLSGDGIFTALFAKGWVKGNKTVTLEGGLHGIMDGLKRLKEGLSAEKLAYTISV
ncbi:Zinc-binding oxidoreductase alcohol dehydrogenase [Tilletia horrida]|nr:Zinc-binding oxidoreductase alcohol dehydrogenase [Tilletia horrida]